MLKNKPRRGVLQQDLLLHKVDAGMSTAEYAIGTVAAAALAAILYTVVTGDSVIAALTDLVQKAFSVKF